MSLTPAKAIALLVFLGAVAGATYGVQTIVTEKLGQGLVSAEAVHPKLAVTPGNDVTLAIGLFNGHNEPHDVSVEARSDLFRATSSLARLPPETGTTVFLTVTIPADAAVGDHPVSVHLLDEQGRAFRERGGLVALRVLGADEGVALARGDAANVTFTGRLADTGTAFQSNDPALKGRAFPRVGTFTAKPYPFTLPNGDEQVPFGLYAAIVGMKEGESRSVRLEAEQAFGNATLTTSMPREEVIPLETTYPNQERPEPREEWNKRIRDSGQGDPTKYKAGDTFTITNDRTGNSVRYVLTQINEFVVRYRLALQVGDTLTLYNAWPNASVVTRADQLAITFQTTPNSEVGDKVTFYEHWPQATEVVALNETEVTVRHTPPLGAQHKQPFGQAEVEFTVKEITDDEVVFSFPSDQPLAGKAVVYDVRVDTIRKRS